MLQGNHFIFESISYIGTKCIRSPLSLVSASIQVNYKTCSQSLLLILILFFILIFFFLGLQTTVKKEMKGDMTITIMVRMMKITGNEKLLDHGSGVY